MVRSLAGQAASAARRALSRRSGAEPDGSPEDELGTGASSTEKAAPAKKAAAKKAAAEKTAATKKTASKKATKTAAATKTATKQSTPAKKTATRAPEKKTITKAPAKKAPARKAAKATAPNNPPTTATTTAAAHEREAEPVKKADNAVMVAPPVEETDQVQGTLVVKEGEDSWTEEEIAEVLAELHEQREHSLAMVTEQAAGLSGLMRDSGDGAGQDQADMGATSFERDHELTVLSIEQDKLHQIDRALLRLGDGTYGVCESCEQPIGKNRLLVFPRATLCLTCKQREERR